MKNEPVFLTSRQNAVVVQTAKLQDKKHRDAQGLFLAQGDKLAEEAIRSGAPISYLMATQNAYERLLQKGLLDTLDCTVYVVSESIFEKISTEKSPQGVLCVIKDLDFLHKKYIIYGRDSKNAPTDTKIVLCDIQDPGNLGTMLRSANAFGIGEVILVGECADLYHPRTVRAAMGALFRQAVAVCKDSQQTIAQLNALGYHTYAATLHQDAIPLPRLVRDRTNCFVIGNEGHGLGQAVVCACTGAVNIPMQPETESLNAAVAASIFMWETVR